jgi:ribosomal RNA-processing protein 36
MALQERRDPRFSSMSAGNTDTNLTATSYSFVPKLIEEEYQNLRSALQLAVKRERTSPRHEREDRVAER